MLELFLFIYLLYGSPNYLKDISAIDSSAISHVTDSITISIEAKKLSEDMHILSSKNDEILLLIYEQSDSTELIRLILQKDFLFDRENRFDQFKIALDISQIEGRLIFFLIEQDSETPIEQIDPIIRVQYVQIIDAFEAGDYVLMEKYIGDEDLLGINYLSDFKRENIELEFAGFYKLDKFQYLINLTK